jgi:hypothetical protein
MLSFVAWQHFMVSIPSPYSAKPGRHLLKVLQTLAAAEAAAEGL